MDVYAQPPEQCGCKDGLLNSEPQQLVTALAVAPHISSTAPMHPVRFESLITIVLQPPSLLPCAQVLRASKLGPPSFRAILSPVSLLLLQPVVCLKLHALNRRDNDHIWLGSSEMAKR
jgi:hypothetical protein